MAMRIAQRKQELSQIGKRPALLSRVELNGRDGRSHQFEVSSVLSVVTGRNGGGKTTLLRALAGFLRDPVDYRDPLFASATMEGSLRGAKWVATTGGLNSPPFPVVYVDVVKTVLQLLGQIEEDQQPEDWLDGVDPAPLDSELAEWAQYIIGREYEEVLVYEVTAFSPEDDAQPFFRVRAHGRTYTSAEMGRGELATFHLLWQLDRLEKGTLALIEEPESNLAAYSQTRMLEALAVMAKKGDHQFVVASHYPDAFNTLPGTVVLDVQKLPTFMVAPQVPRHALDTLPSSSSSLTVLVEDDVAATFLLCIVEELVPDLVSLVRVWKIGSESMLTGLSKELRDHNDRPQPGFLLVLDGDRRSYLAADGRASREPWLCSLPGAWGPEETLKRLLSERLAGNTVLAPDVTAMLANALRENEGLEIHDWFFGCSRPFGSFLGLWRAAWPLFKGCQSSYEQAQELAMRLVNAARS